MNVFSVSRLLIDDQSFTKVMIDYETEILADSQH